MAFNPELQQDEQIQHVINVTISKNESFRLVLTSRAAYWPGKNSLSDAETTEVLPTSQIQSVQIRRRSAWASLAVGILLVLVGLVLTLAGRFRWPPILIVGGIIVGLIGHKRRVLVLASETDRFAWKEPIIFGGGVKQSITAAFGQIDAWAREHGIRVQNDLIS